VRSRRVDRYIKLIYVAGMAARQKSRYAILGLLSWNPMSGYDIKKLVDVGLSHFWSENYGQIYPTLESLVEERLATKREAASSGKRKRYTYSITRKGRRAFQKWIEEPTASPIVRNEWQLKFFLSRDLPTEQTLRLVRHYQTQQREMLQQYRESAAVLEPAMQSDEVPEELDEILRSTGATGAGARNQQCVIFHLTLRHGIRVIESRLAWCDEVIRSLK